MVGGCRSNPTTEHLRAEADAVMLASSGISREVAFWHLDSAAFGDGERNPLRLGHTTVAVRSGSIGDELSEEEAESTQRIVDRR